MTIEPETLRALLSVDTQLWRKEVAEIRAYLERFGARLPVQMLTELKKTAQALGA
jgi:GTP-dependent phosphoenolpyruvate carboxykinase